MYDVAVIGAGPSGSAAALKTGEKGWKTALIERDEYAGKNNVCAGGLDYETLERFGLRNNVIEKKISTLSIVGPYGLIGEHKIRSITVQRKVFDRAAAEQASKVCDYFTQTPVEKVERVNRHWAVHAKGKKFRAKIVVFADGPNSTVRRKLGIGFTPKPKNCYVSMIREFESGETGNAFEMVFDEKVSPIGYGWLFPKKGHVNIGLGFIASTRANTRKNMDYLIQKYYPGFWEKKPFLETGALIPARIAEKNADERGLLCVGDAGGFVEPLTGGGISFGVSTGIESSEIVHEALQAENIAHTKSFDARSKRLVSSKIFYVESLFLDMVNQNHGFYQDTFPKLFGGNGFSLGIGILGRAFGAQNFFAKGFSTKTTKGKA